MDRGWLGLVVFGALLHSACGSTGGEPPTSDGKQQTGGEAGAPVGEGGTTAAAAGQSGSAPGGVGGSAGSEAGDAGSAGMGSTCDDECLANRPPLWIVYGAGEVQGVRADQLDKAPVHFDLGLTSDEDVYAIGNWSPDGSSVVVITEFPVLNPKGPPDLVGTHAYLLRFVDGSPAQPLKLAVHGAYELKAFTWSPSGKILLFSDGGRLYDIDPTATQTATPTPVSSEGHSAQRLWFKSDHEIVYLTRSASSKIDAVLAVKQGSAWQVETIAPDLGIGGGSALDDVVATSDRSELYYTAPSKAGLSLWSVPTKVNSAQHLVAGPFGDLAFRLSPDDQRYLLAAATAQNRTATIYGGDIASLSDPPVIVDSSGLLADESLGSVSNTWSNDSRHAVAFEFDDTGKHPVLYEVGAAKPWQPLPVALASTDAAWSPDSKALAVLRAAPDSGSAPSLLASSGRKQLDLPIPAAQSGFDMMRFSPSSEFFVYGYRNLQPDSHSLYYQDLRRGLTAAEKPSVLAQAFSPDFSTDGTRMIYQNQDDCFFLDLAKADAPVSLSAGSGIYACSIQKLIR